MKFKRDETAFQLMEEILTKINPKCISTRFSRIFAVTISTSTKNATAISTALQKSSYFNVTHMKA